MKIYVRGVKVAVRHIPYELMYAKRYMASTSKFGKKFQAEAKAATKAKEIGARVFEEYVICG